jgi:sucrose phosphorylase
MDLDQNTPPRDCTWLNFSASHDGIGLRPLEGLVPDDEVALLLDAMRVRGGYISSRRRPDGGDAPYELNISLFDAFRDPTRPQDPWQLPAFRVGQLVTLSLKGIPALYLHSLTATPNDHAGVERTGRTRSINRRSWDRGELERLLADGSGPAARMLRELRHALAVRRRHRAFHPDAPQELLLLGYHLFGVARTAPEGGGRVVCLFNFTPEERSVSLDEPFWQASPETPWRDLLSGDRARSARGRLLLPPYGAYWLVPGG